MDVILNAKCFQDGDRDDGCGGSNVRRQAYEALVSYRQFTFTRVRNSRRQRNPKLADEDGFETTASASIIFDDELAPVPLLSSAVGSATNLASIPVT